MQRTLLTAAVLFGLPFLLPSYGFAQLLQPGGPEARGIVGTGSATIEIPVQRMRMYVDLTARGADVRKAVAALKDRMEAARTSVAALKADPDSIEIGPPRIDAAMSEAHQQLRQQVLEGLGRAGRNTEEANADSLVTVTAKLTAEWDFTGVDHVEALAKSHELQQKLRDAKLSGRDDAAGLPAEAKELLEEAMMMGQVGEEASGDPLFIFLADVTAEREKAALKEAVESAKRQAGGLAEAAGVTLGRLLSLKRIAAANVGGYDEQSVEYGSASYQAMQLANRVQAAAKNPQAAGISPGKLSYRVEVRVGFDVGD